MDILAGSRHQTFSSQLSGRVYFNCKCAMLTFNFNNTIQTLIMLYIKVLFILSSFLDNILDNNILDNILDNIFILIILDNIY